MTLTPFQKASFRQHIHSSEQVIDPATGVPIETGGGTDAIDAAIAAHAAASDPHPGYDTAAEVAAAIAALPAGFSNPMTTAGDIIYESGGVDRALAGTASSDTGIAGGSPAASAINDGDDATETTTGGEAQPNLSFQIDLGSPIAISQWRVLYHSNSGFGAPSPTTALESSTDSSSWTQRDTHVLGAADTGLKTLSAPITARYWRIRNTTTTATRLTVKTFSLFDAVVPSRLAKGTLGQVLAQGAAAPGWQSNAKLAYLDAVDAAAPANPAAGIHRIYSKSGGLYFRDSAGVEVGPLGTGGAAFAGAKAYSNATQAVTTGADRAITFNAEDWDTDAYHEGVTNPSRFTIPAGKGGKYLCTAHVYGLSTASHDVRFRVNGTTLYSDTLYNATAGSASTLSAELDLAAGDYVEVVIFPAANVTLGNASVREAMNDMSVHLIGGAPSTGVVPTAHGARVTRSANQSVGNNTLTAVSFTAEDYDTDAIHDNSTNPTRLTIPAIVGVTTGLWSVKAACYTDQSTCDLQLKVNGTPFAFFRNTNTAEIGAAFLAADWVFTVGDYVELFVRTPAGAGNVVFDAGVSPEMSIAFLGKVS